MYGRVKVTWYKNLGIYIDGIVSAAVNMRKCKMMNVYQLKFIYIHVKVSIFNIIEK